MLSHTVTPLSNGLVSLSIELCPSMLSPILNAFHAMSELARSANTKARTATAPLRAKELLAQNERHYLSYCDAIIKKFDEIYLTGIDVRECIKEANKQIKPLYPNTCYDQVKHILAKSGRLKKKSFNMKKKD